MKAVLIPLIVFTLDETNYLHILAEGQQVEEELHLLCDLKKRIPMKQLVNRIDKRHFSYLLLFLIVLAILCSFCKITQVQDDFQTLSTWLQHSDAPNSFYHHLTGEAYQLLDMREEKTAQLSNPGEWKQRQEQIKQAMWDAVSEEKFTLF